MENLVAVVAVIDIVRGWANDVADAETSWFCCCCGVVGSGVADDDVDRVPLLLVLLLLWLEEVL